MENQDLKDLRQKLNEYFNERLKDLEEKSLQHLKELEYLKYESFIITNISNNDDPEELQHELIEEFKNSDLFLSYFNKKEPHKFEICLIEEFTIEKIDIKHYTTENDLKLKKKKILNNENNSFVNKFNNLKKIGRLDNLRRSPQNYYDNFQTQSDLYKKFLNQRNQNNPKRLGSFNSKLMINDLKKQNTSRTEANNLKISDRSMNVDHVPDEQRYLYTEADLRNSPENLPNLNLKKNFVSNNILYENISNTSNIYNDSFFRSDNYGKNIIETEPNEVQYVLTETSEITKETIKVKSKKKKEDNFINNLKNAINFTNTIRNMQLLNNNKTKLYETSKTKNSDNINRTNLINGKTENHSRNKKTIGNPSLERISKLKECSPIANLINNYFEKLDNQLINPSNSSRGKNEKEIINNIKKANNSQNLSRNNINCETKLIVDFDEDRKKKILKFEKNLENNEKTQHKILKKKEREKSPEFGLNNIKPIIKIKKSSEEDNINELEKINQLHQSFEDYKKEVNKDEILKKKLNLDFSKIQEMKNLLYEKPVKSSRNKNLSYDKIEMDFYLSQKNVNSKKIKDDYKTRPKRTDDSGINNENMTNDDNQKQNFTEKSTQKMENNKINYNNYQKQLSSRSKTPKSISIIKDTNFNHVKDDLKNKTNKEIKNVSSVIKDNKRPTQKKKMQNILEKRKDENIISEEKQNDVDLINYDDKFEDNLENSDTYKENNEINESKRSNERQNIKNEEKNSKSENSSNIAENEMTQFDSVNKIQDEANRRHSFKNFHEYENQIEKSIQNNLKKDNEHNHSISNKSILDKKEDSGLIKQKTVNDHRKNFSFNASFYDKLKKNNLSENQNNESILPSTLKKNSSEKNKAKKENISSNNKKNYALNPQILNNKNNKIKNKKNSLEIKTDIINDNFENDLKEPKATTTRNSLKLKEQKFDFHATKIHTSKHVEKKKIVFTDKSEKNLEINDMKQSLLNQNETNHRKSFSRDSFNTVINFNRLDIKEKTDFKVKIPTNKDKEGNGEKLNKHEENPEKDKENNKEKNIRKTNKNLSIINEKDNPNSEKKNSNAVNFNKKAEKINKKNLSLDIDNLNNNTDEGNSNVMSNKTNKNLNNKLNLKSKDESEKKNESFGNKENKEKPDKSRDKDKNREKSKSIDKFNQNEEKNIKNKKHRVSKSVITDGNLIENINSSKELKHKVNKTRESKDIKEEIKSTDEKNDLKQTIEKKKRSSSHDRKRSILMQNNLNNNENENQLQESKSKRKNPFRLVQTEKGKDNDKDLKKEEEEIKEKPNSNFKRNNIKKNINENKNQVKDNKGENMNNKDIGKNGENINQKVKKSIKNEEKDKLSNSKVRKIIKPTSGKLKPNFEESKQNNEESNEKCENRTETIIQEDAHIDKNQNSAKDIEPQKNNENAEEKDEIPNENLKKFDELLKTIVIDEENIYKKPEIKEISDEETDFKKEINEKVNKEESFYEEKKKYIEDEGKSHHLSTPKFSPKNKNENIDKISSEEKKEIEKEVEKEKSIEILDLYKKQLEKNGNILEIIKNHKKNSKKFENQLDETLYFIFNSGFLPIEKKIIFFKHIKVLRKLLSEEEILSFKKICLQEKININEKILSKYLTDQENSVLICEPFKATKTAKNGLSLFSKEEENNLINKDQPKEIINFFKFTVLLLNLEISEEDAQHGYVKAFFKKIIPENMNIKNFLIEISNNIYLIDDKNFDLVHTFIKENPDVIKSTELLRKNRTCSYMSFLIKEIYEYYSAKADDGFYIFKLRNLYQNTKELKELIKKEN